MNSSIFSQTMVCIKNIIDNVIKIMRTYSLTTVSWLNNTFLPFSKFLTPIFKIEKYLCDLNKNLLFETKFGAFPLVLRWQFPDIFEKPETSLRNDFRYNMEQDTISFSVITWRGHLYFSIRNPSRKVLKFSLSEYSSNQKIRVWTLMKKWVIKTILTKFLSFDQFCYIFWSKNHHSKIVICFKYK